MANPYEDYYINQAGNGMTVYEGLQYQRGHGFFGSFFTNIIKPLTKYLGKKALETGMSVGSDVLQGENLNASLIKNLKKSGKRVMEDGAERLKTFAQTGNGRKRRKVSKQNKKKRPSKKRSVAKLTSKRKRKTVKKTKKQRKTKKSSAKKRRKQKLTTFKHLFE